MNRARATAAAGVALCAVAALLAASELYVPGVALLLAAGLAPLWVATAARGCEVTLACDATSVAEGGRVLLTVTVTRGRIPGPGSQLLPVPGWGDLPRLAHRHTEATLAAVVAHRGLQSIGPARLRIADPFGISVREVCSEEIQLLVLPRVHPVHSPGESRLDGRARSARAAALEFDALLPYVPGASASRIHWPTVARTGMLLERGLAAETDPSVLVVLDSHRPESEEALDRALRATASLCVHLAALGGCELLLPGDARPALVGRELAGWGALHARLALVRGGELPQRNLRVRRGRSVIHVSATASARTQPGEHGWRVSPFPLAGHPTAFTVAGCTGHAFGERAQAGAA